MNDNLHSLRHAFGIGTSLLVESHSISSFLSSPYTTQKLTETQEEVNQIWGLFWEATALSFVYGIIIGYILKVWTPIIALIPVTFLYWYAYDDAIKNSPYGTKTNQNKEVK